MVDGVDFRSRARTIPDSYPLINFRPEGAQFWRIASHLCSHNDTKRVFISKRDLNESDRKVTGGFPGRSSLRMPKQPASRAVRGGSPLPWANQSCMSHYLTLCDSLRYSASTSNHVESLLLVLEGTGAFGIRLAGIRLVAAEGRNS